MTLSAFNTTKPNCSSQHLRLFLHTVGDTAGLYSRGCSGVHWKTRHSARPASQRGPGAGGP